jgi:hypothetical protein
MTLNSTPNGWGDCESLNKNTSIFSKVASVWKAAALSLVLSSCTTNHGENFSQNVEPEVKLKAKTTETIANTRNEIAKINESVILSKPQIETEITAENFSDFFEIPDEELNVQGTNIAVFYDNKQPNQWMVANYIKGSPTSQWYGKVIINLDQITIDSIRDFHINFTKEEIISAIKSNNWEIYSDLDNFLYTLSDLTQGRLTQEDIYDIKDAIEANRNWTMANEIGSIKLLALIHESWMFSESEKKTLLASRDILEMIWDINEQSEYLSQNDIARYLRGYVKYQNTNYSQYKVVEKMYEKSSLAVIWNNSMNKWNFSEAYYKFTDNIEENKPKLDTLLTYNKRFFLGYVNKIAWDNAAKIISKSDIFDYSSSELNNNYYASNSNY